MHLFCRHRWRKGVESGRGGWEDGGVMKRCPWVPLDKPLYVKYHDEEWGTESRDRNHVFEMLCLEGQQAGLSWWTVLQKRARYREVFHRFIPELVAEMSDAEMEELLQDAGVIRHRGKLEAVRTNARAWVNLEEKGVDVVEWLWGFVGGKTQVLRPKRLGDYRAESEESRVLSKALKKAGFSFVGPTILYSFFHAVGMVDEHSAECFLAAARVGTSSDRP